MAIAEQLAATSDSDDRIAIWTDDQRISWSQLAGVYRGKLKSLATWKNQRVGLALTSNANGIASLAALQDLRADVFLFDIDTPEEQCRRWIDRFSLQALLLAEDRIQASTIVHDTAQSSGGSVTILTSGTTGEPKAVRHTWKGLTRPVRQTMTDDPQRWLLAFRPHLYAGLQVILQALANHQTLVVPTLSAEPNSVINLMVDAAVEYASATPSFWRRLVMFADSSAIKRVPLRQITLGGEVVDQSLLDRLHDLFPSARLAHIYATTEMGRCFAVSDGCAGFPISYLQAPTADGVEMRLEAGELWVRSANAMSGYENTTELTDDRNLHQGWFPTRDVVEVQGERVFFVGRRSDMINVGGNKVYPVAVEKVIRQLVEVADVRVFGVPSSVAGQLVACDVVPAAGVSPEQVRKNVMRVCQQQLDRYQCPRIVEIKRELDLNDAGKIAR